VTKDPDFDYVREDIVLYREYLADRSVSLNLETRRAEKEKNEARMELRKQERASRPSPRRRSTRSRSRRWVNRACLNPFRPRGRATASASIPIDEEEAGRAETDELSPWTLP
jgi:hypothetical protein